MFNPFYLGSTLSIVPSRCICFPSRPYGSPCAVRNSLRTRALDAGNAIQAGIDSGLKVEGIEISDAPLLDIGTPDNLAKAMARFAGVPSSN